MNIGRGSVLLMLDLNAAFETIDHGILINRLSVSFWIDEAILNYSTHPKNLNTPWRKGLFYMALNGIE